ncbi:hypothetical protein MP638_001046 [Amoeboaphelidium occidentale]|nr:hypothetical protein MP638_001046 [Amoeboaphelidium occidentale]
MSTLYIQEPATLGKIVLETTLGDVEIELWPKEAPKAVRNFVQLCLDGYFNDTIFHRLVPRFIIQGGDPTGTGEGGESIYGKPFEDEFHQRLKFNHRGIVAMANPGEPDSNMSQFFITLDSTPNLNGKHTIFGKVVGDTIYNLLKANDMDVDENDRPLIPIKILRSKVLRCPFGDLKPRVAADRSATEKKEQQKAPRKAVKNKALLSFEDETESGAASFVRPKRPKKEVEVSPVTEEVLPEPKEILPEPKEPIIPETVPKVKPPVQEEADTAKKEKKKKKESYLEQERKKFFKSNSSKLLLGAKKKERDEDELLSKLASFKKKIQQANETVKEEKVQSLCSLHNVPDCESCFNLEKTDVDEKLDCSWIGHRLEFDKDLKGKDLLDPNTKKDDPYELVVIDPLAGIPTKELNRRRANNAAGKQWDQNKLRVTD